MIAIISAFRTTAAYKGLSLLISLITVFIGGAAFVLHTLAILFSYLDLEWAGMSKSSERLGK